MRWDNLFFPRPLSHVFSDNTEVGTHPVPHLHAGVRGGDDLAIHVRLERLFVRRDRHQLPGVSLLRREADAAVYEVAAVEYHFTAG